MLKKGLGKSIKKVKVKAKVDSNPCGSHWAFLRCCGRLDQVGVVLRLRRGFVEVGVEDTRTLCEESVCFDSFRDFVI